MNRNPGRPKRVMKLCPCGSEWTQCICEVVNHQVTVPGYVHIPLMVLAVSMLLLGLYYLIWG